MKEKPTLEIRVPGSHAKNDRHGIYELVISFLVRAGITGEVCAIMGHAVTGRPHLRGINGIQVKRIHGHRVVIRAQPGSNDSACELKLSPPSGMTLEAFWEKLRMAESRNAQTSEEADNNLDGCDVGSGNDGIESEIEDDDDSSEEGVVLIEEATATSSSLLVQAEVDRLGNEYIEIDERAKQKKRTCEAGYSRVHVLRNELKSLERRIESAIEDQRGAELRASEIRETISQLTMDLRTVMTRVAEAQEQQKKAAADRVQRQAEIDTLLKQADRDQAEATRLTAEAEALQKKHAKAEAEMRTKVVADKLKGVSIEELIAAAKLAGLNIQAAK